MLRGTQAKAHGSHPSIHRPHPIHRRYWIEHSVRSHSHRTPAGEDPHTDSQTPERVTPEETDRVHKRTVLPDLEVLDLCEWPDAEWIASRLICVGHSISQPQRGTDGIGSLIVSEESGISSPSISQILRPRTVFNTDKWLMH